MQPVKTFTATIYAGTKEGYTGLTHSIEEVNAILQRYCDKKGLCVSVTETHFIYTNGDEPGVAVGLINYPRFPVDPAVIEKTAMEIATDLRVLLNQQRVSVVFPDYTLTLEEEKAA